MQPIANPAAGLDQPCRRQIREVDHQPRRQGKHVHAAIRFQGQDRAALHDNFSECERRSGSETQSGRQSLVGPCLAALRYPHRVGIGGIEHGGGAQGTAQGIVRRHCLDLRQQRGVTQADHARESGALRLAQAACRRLLEEALGQGMIGAQQQVAAKQLVGLQAQRLLDAVGQEADAGQCRHRQHQRDAQHRQFAGAPVAGEHAQCEP